MRHQTDVQKMAYWLERDGASCQKHVDAAELMRGLEAANEELSNELHHLERIWEKTNDRAKALQKRMEELEKAPANPQAVLYVSKVQLEAHKNPDGPAHDDFGRYIPARKTPSGKFTTPLFTHPAEKLTEEQKNVMYDFATLSRGTPLEWFKAGIEASERQHKIGTI
jgi:hypothetical protein